MGSGAKGLGYFELGELEWFQDCRIHDVRLPLRFRPLGLLGIAGRRV